MVAVASAVGNSRPAQRRSRPRDRVVRPTASQQRDGAGPTT